MTISTAGQKNASPSQSAQTLTTPQNNLTRQIEIVTLNPNGSLHVADHNTPALSLFDNIFAAFTSGTLINTPNGQISIEDLNPGDLITTKGGKPSRILWISSSTLVPAHQERNTPLVRIMADTFGKNCPPSFLTIGPSARLLTTAQQQEKIFPHHNNTPMLTQGNIYIDNLNVIKICPPTPVRLFHICLEQHSIINVGGIDMETYHPGLSFPLESSPEIRRKFLSMFPNITRLSDFGPLNYSRMPDSA